MLFVVEVVKERGGGPGFKERIAIFAGETGGICMTNAIGTNAGFDSEGVFDEAGRLCVLVEKGPGAFAGVRRLGHRVDILFGFLFRVFQAFPGYFHGDSQFLLDKKDTYQAMYLQG
jgi:hypothetical protein